MDAPKVVEHEMQRDSVGVVFNLLRKSIRLSREAAHVVLAYFDQRVAAALRAIVLRSAGESLAALALPPLRPPSRPRATAAGFRLSSADGLASVNSPVAISTISLASWF